MKKWLPSFLRWLLFALYFGFLAMIIFFAIQGREHIGLVVNRIPHGDKLGHFGLYGAAAFFANLAASCRTLSIYNRPLLVGSLLVALLCTLEESSQIFISTRTFSFLDLFANYLGVLFLGPLAIFFVQKHPHPNPNNTPHPAPRGVP